MRGRKLSKEKIDMILLLKKKGYTNVSITAQTGVNDSTVSEIVRHGNKDR